jgi:hypothetical protein
MAEVDDKTGLPNENQNLLAEAKSTDYASTPPPDDDVPEFQTYDSPWKDYGSYSHGACRDVPYAIAFIINVLVLCGLCAIYYDADYFKKSDSKSNKSSAHLADNSSFLPLSVVNSERATFETGLFRPDLQILLFQALGIGMALALAWLIALQYCARTLIQISLGLAVILPGAMAILMFAQGQVIGGLILLLFCALSICWWYMVQNRIKLAANMLIIASTFIRRHCSLVFVSLITLALSVGWIVLWAVTMYCTLMKTGAIEKNADGSTGSNKAGFGVMFYFFLTYFWGITVLSNTLHVTTSGAFAEWFLIPDGSTVERLGVISVGSQYKVCNSLYRALTTSFGSICYGSFLISVIRALKACIREETQDGEENAFVLFLSCIARCILSCIEDIMEFMNTYAYVHVAIYGDDFCSAGEKTWNLILHAGWDLVINDDITGTALVFGCTMLSDPLLRPVRCCPAR